MKSIFDLDERVVAAGSYLLGFITGIVVLVLEKSNRFVRFHALQSIVTFGALAIIIGALDLLGGIIGIIPLLGWAVAFIIGLIVKLIGLVGVVAWLWLMYSSWKGREFRVPIIGDIVWAQVNK